MSQWDWFMTVLTFINIVTVWLHWRISEDDKGRYE